MKRLRCKFGKCKWTKERSFERCSVCGDVFPCKEGCAHADCQDARGHLDKCAVCGQEIKDEDRFNVYGPSSWVPVHLACAGMEKIKEVQAPLPFQSTVGTLVKIVDTLEEMYRLQIGDLVEDLAIEKVIDADRVVVKWIGVVPVSHLRSK